MGRETQEVIKVLGVAAVISLIMLAMGVVGNGDYEDALADEEFYKEMVCKGAWPDYNNLGVVCEDIKAADGRG